MAILKPATRPDNPRFSSGPCAKPPTWNHRSLAGAWLGRSHRASGGKWKLMDAINKTRQILEIPTDYKIGIVPASDTGAYEMAMWSMLGKRPVEMVAWERFGAGWRRTQPRYRHKNVRHASFPRTSDYIDIVSDRHSLLRDVAWIISWLLQL